jgi:hypothetical protein
MRMTQDRWAALVCLAFAVFVIIAMPYQTSDRPIPGARGFDLLDGAFFPKFAVAIFIVASVWMFISGARDVPSPLPGAASMGAPSAASGMDEEPPGLTLRDFLYASALTVGVLAYVVLLAWAGYLLSTILAVTMLALVCGQRSWLGLFVGAVLFPIVVYYAFAHLFMVPLPRAQFW